MAWVAVNRDGTEYIYQNKPKRGEVNWQDLVYDTFYTDILLPYSSIKRLIGRDLTWQDEAVELNNYE